MQFFITGASGYIGGVVTEKAIADGHTVHGLCRSDAGEAKLKALGAVPVRGELSSLDILQSESAKADAVIHCAFIHDFSGKTSHEEIMQIDIKAVDAIAKGLKGSNKPLVTSSGTLNTRADPNGGEVDEVAPVNENSPLKIRAISDDNATAKAKDGIRVSTIRLAPFVFGRGGSGFTPWLISKAFAAKESIYIGDGSTRTTTVHVDDAADLYLLAAQHPTGGSFNASDSTTVTAKDMADAIGKLLNVPVRSVTAEEGAKEDKLGGFLTMITTMECRASSKKARTELGWTPKSVDWVTDVSTGSYKALAAKLG